MSAFELIGYNKVADNTFVNIVPMTTGKFVKELPWTKDMKIRVYCGIIFVKASHAYEFVSNRYIRHKLCTFFFKCIKIVFISLLILDMDSVSRSNMIRYMPETRTYLLQNISAFELIGYNKVADNTFVNIVPMTTGICKETVLNNPT
jgi:hypothetical protein